MSLPLVPLRALVPGPDVVSVTGLVCFGAAWLLLWSFDLRRGPQRGWLLGPAGGRPHAEQRQGGRQSVRVHQLRLSKSAEPHAGAPQRIVLGSSSGALRLQILRLILMMKVKNAGMVLLSPKLRVSSPQCSQSLPPRIQSEYFVLTHSAHCSLEFVLC